MKEEVRSQSGLGGISCRGLWCGKPLRAERAAFRKMYLLGGSEGMGLEVRRRVGDHDRSPSRDT